MSSTPHPGPYKVETFPNGGTFNSRWVGMGRRGVFTTELAAKDACLELNASYLAGQASREQQWIPVGERLPEKIDDYLVVILEDGLPEHTAYVTAASFSRGKWDTPSGIDCAYGSSLDGPVTHWMPLPAAPTNNSDR